MGNFNLDDSDDLNLDLDMPGLDSGMVDDMDIGTREPVATPVHSFTSSVKSSMISPMALNRTLRGVLPESYSTAYDMVDEGLSFADDLKDEVKKTLDPAIKGFKAATRSMLPMVRSVLPKSLTDKLSAALETDDERQYSAQLSKEQVDEASIAGAMAEIWKTQEIKELQEGEEKKIERATEKLTDTVATERTLSLGSSTRALIERLVSYQDDITSAYQKRSLELQFRQYFAARDLLEIAQATLKDALANLKVIAHNTGLPDTQKELSSESFSKMRRELLFGKAAEGLGGALRTYGDRIKGAIRGKVMGGVETFSGLLTTASDLATMQQSMAGLEDLSDEELTPEQLEQRNRLKAAETAGMLASETIIGRLIKKIAPKVAENEKIMDIGSNLKYYTQNWQTLLNQELGKESTIDVGNETLNTTLNSLFDFLKDIIPSLGGGRSDAIATSLSQYGTRVSQFDELTRRSIIEIIPGFLSRILQGVDKLVTGDKEADRLVYDVDTEQFLYREEASKKFKERIAGEDKARSVRGSFDSFFDYIDRDNQLLGSSKAVLRKQLLTDVLQGKHFNPFKYTSSRGYSDKVPDKVLANIKSVIGKRFSRDASGGFTGNKDVLTEATQLYNNLEHAFQSNKDLLDKMVLHGEREIADFSGYITADNRLDQQRLISELTAYADTDEPEKQPVAPLAVKPTLLSTIIEPVSDEGLLAPLTPPVIRSEAYVQVEKDEEKDEEKVRERGEKGGKEGKRDKKAKKDIPEVTLEKERSNVINITDIRKAADKADDAQKEEMTVATIREIEEELIDQLGDTEASLMDRLDQEMEMVKSIQQVAGTLKTLAVAPRDTHVEAGEKRAPKKDKKDVSRGTLGEISKLVSDKVEEKLTLVKSSPLIGAIQDKLDAIISKREDNLDLGDEIDKKIEGELTRALSAELKRKKEKEEAENRRWIGTPAATARGVTEPPSQHRPVSMPGEIVINEKRALYEDGEGEEEESALQEEAKKPKRKKNKGKKTKKAKRDTEKKEEEVPPSVEEDIEQPKGSTLGSLLGKLPSTGDIVKASLPLAGGFAGLGLRAPGMILPKIGMPDIKLPKMDLSKVAMPKLPELAVPKLAVPDISLPSMPEVKMPKIPKLSKIELPKMEFSEKVGKQWKTLSTLGVEKNKALADEIMAGDISSSDELDKEIEQELSEAMYETLSGKRDWGKIKEVGRSALGRLPEKLPKVPGLEGKFPKIDLKKVELPKLSTLKERLPKKPELPSVALSGIEDVGSLFKTIQDNVLKAGKGASKALAEYKGGNPVYDVPFVDKAGKDLRTPKDVLVSIEKKISKSLKKDRYSDARVITEEGEVIEHAGEENFRIDLMDMLTSMNTGILTMAGAVDKGLFEEPSIMRTLSRRLQKGVSSIYEMSKGALSGTLDIGTEITSGIGGMLRSGWRGLTTEPILDIYYYGEDEKEPRMRRRKLLKGHYLDVASKKTVKYIKDVTGEVVDLENNNEVILTADELKDGGLYTRNSEGKIGTILQGIKALSVGGLQNVFDISMFMTTLPKRVAKISRYIQSHGDLYAKDSTSPVLLSHIMRKGGYISVKTRKPIYKVSDIDGPVMDINGDIVLTMEQLKEGLLDKHGKKVDLRGIPERVFDFFLGVGKSAVRNLKATYDTIYGGLKKGYEKGSEYAKEKVKEWAGVGKDKSDELVELLKEKGIDFKDNLPDMQKLFSKMSDLQTQAMDRLKQGVMETNRFLSDLTVHGAEQISVLKDIYALLDARLESEDDREKVKEHRKGSWQEMRERRRKEAEAKKAALPAVAGAGATMMEAANTGSMDDADEDSPSLLDRIKGGVTDFIGGKALSMGKKALAVGGGALAAVKTAGVGATVMSGVTALGAKAAGAGAATAGLLSAPVVIGGAALLGGAYLGYRLYRSNRLGRDVTPLERLRMLQYGINPDDDDQVKAIRELEEDVAKSAKVGGRGESLTVTFKIQDKRAFSRYSRLFNIDEDDRASVVNWYRWYKDRFLVILSKYIAAVRSNKLKDIYAYDALPVDLDNKSSITSVLSALNIPERLYSIPVEGFMGVESGDIEAYRETLSGMLKDTVSVDTRPAPVAEKMEREEPPEPIEDDETPLPVPAIPSVPTEGDKPMAEEVIDLQMPEEDKTGKGLIGEPDELERFRFMQYGINPNDKHKLSTIRLFERTVAGNIGYKVDNLRKTKPFEQYREYASLFPGSTSTTWIPWYARRFLTVLAKYIKFCKENNITSIADLHTWAIAHKEERNRMIRSFFINAFDRYSPYKVLYEPFGDPMTVTTKDIMSAYENLRTGLIDIIDVDRKDIIVAKPTKKETTPIPEDDGKEDNVIVPSPEALSIKTEESKATEEEEIDLQLSEEEGIKEKPNGKPDSLERLRYLQYGIDCRDKDKVSRIRCFERKVAKQINYDAVMLRHNKAPKQFQKYKSLFPGTIEGTWTSWYNRRFLVVLAEYIKFCKEYKVSSISDLYKWVISHKEEGNNLLRRVFIPPLSSRSPYRVVFEPFADAMVVQTKDIVDAFEYLRVELTDLNDTEKESAITVKPAKALTPSPSPQLPPIGDEPILQLPETPENPPDTTENDKPVADEEIDLQLTESEVIKGTSNGSPDPLERFRFLQYGINYKDKDKVSSIRLFERKIAKQINYDVVILRRNKAPEQYERYESLFPGTIKDIWISWYNRRFLLVVARYISFCKMNNVSDISDLYKWVVLHKDEKYNLLRNVFINPLGTRSPYRVIFEPFGDSMTILTEDIRTAYEDLRIDLLETDKTERERGITIKPAKVSAPSPSPVEDKPALPMPEPLKTPENPPVAVEKEVSIADEVIDLQIPEREPVKRSNGKLNSLERLRFMQYGINPNDKDKLPYLREFEEAIASEIKYDLVMLRDNRPQTQFQKYESLFPGTIEGIWTSWYSRRFLVVVAGYIKFCKEYKVSSIASLYQWAKDHTEERNNLLRIVFIPPLSSRSPYRVMFEPFGDSTTIVTKDIVTAFENLRMELNEIHDGKKSSAVTITPARKDTTKPISIDETDNDRVVNPVNEGSSVTAKLDKEADTVTIVPIEDNNSVTDKLDREDNNVSANVNKVEIPPSVEEDEKGVPSFSEGKKKEGVKMESEKISGIGKTLPRDRSDKKGLDDKVYGELVDGDNVTTRIRTATERNAEERIRAFEAQRAMEHRDKMAQLAAITNVLTQSRDVQIRICETLGRMEKAHKKERQEDKADRKEGEKRLSGDKAEVRLAAPMDREVPVSITPPVDMRRHQYLEEP